MDQPTDPQEYSFVFPVPNRETHVTTQYNSSGEASPDDRESIPSLNTSDAEDALAIEEFNQLEAAGVRGRLFEVPIDLLCRLNVQVPEDRDQKALCKVQVSLDEEWVVVEGPGRKKGQKRERSSEETRAAAGDKQKKACLSSTKEAAVGASDSGSKFGTTSFVAGVAVSFLAGFMLAAVLGEKGFRLSNLLMTSR